MDDEGIEALGVSASIVIFLRFIIPFSTVSFNAIGSVLVQKVGTVTTFLVTLTNIDPASTDMDPILTLTDPISTLTDPS